ncbi:30S ribosomal protein S8 [Blochmannia endosymbiont of Camponotus (Colobopsis) obliquus]|uniref:30S ribosomal protein S8 n=1 Tax=Blochmannia endosymbiont of Camponotus (Colobopsis) obliquus TaxID=1505597 RepID=UPI00061A5588|nr:30S ribosomal protein S8 [Blochmannia endosymbiont of Camponotus (Colobopsis) obliquus]AKC60375.1 30S ribosomal protein S8 [Blochmannia endosymbiont of Camponotus (Colobopsis) obliquus]
MSMQDPIADMLSCIRNGQLANKSTIKMPSSKIKVAISCLLMQEGYISGYKVINNIKPILILTLKYFNSKPVVEFIQRISRPGLRVYRKKNSLPKVMSGMGIAIISTSRGVVTDKMARRFGLGGEIICYVS